MAAFKGYVLGLCEKIGIIQRSKAPSAKSLPDAGEFNGLIKLLRPYQWIKNGFVLAPLLFSGSFSNLSAVGKSLFAMMFFCAGASVAYIINDIHDLEHDRAHPKKSRTRPLASGLVRMPHALVLLYGMLGILVVLFFFQPGVGLVISGYLILNLAYTFVLKNQPVLEIFALSANYVLRVYAGAVALAVPVSSWMFVTTFCLALYLSSIKRRQELLKGHTEGRKALAHYSVSLIERYAEMSGIGAVVFYSLYVFSVHPGMVITIPFVVFGLFRYWFIVEAHDDGEDPSEAFLKDRQLLVTVALWAGACVYAIAENA